LLFGLLHLLLDRSLYISLLSLANVTHLCISAVLGEAGEEIFVLLLLPVILSRQLVYVIALLLILIPQSLHFLFQEADYFF